MTDERFDELLTLTSRPPDDLLGRIRARRAAGEHVLLPPVPPARPAAPPARPVVRVPADRRARRSWRWAAAPAGLAAAALVAVLVQRPGGVAPPVPPASAPGRSAPPPAQDERPDDTRVPRTEPPADVAAGPAAPGGPATSPAVPRARARERLRSAPLAAEVLRAPDAAPPPTTTQLGSATAGRGASFALRTLDGAFTLGLADLPGAPNAQQRPVLDSLARVLAREPGRRVVVRYVDPAFTRESASWRLASRVADYLVARGVAPERLALARVPAVHTPAGGGSEAVEVVVAAP